MGVKEVMHGHTTRIGKLVNQDLNRIDAGVVVQAAREGDPIATAILQRAGMYLGIAVGNILGVISPERVIFGGGVSVAGTHCTNDQGAGPCRSVGQSPIRPGGIRHQRRIGRCRPVGKA